MPANPSLSFGSFDYACSQTALPICPLVGTQLVTPSCYARNIEISSGNLLFEPATIFIECVALLMTGIMIYNIRSKYVAVGRKEIVVLFYMYVATIVNELLLVSGIIPMASEAYKYFVAVHAGFLVATFWTLAFNGFVGFQWMDDGDSKSLWMLRGTTFAAFFVTFLIAILTFKNAAGLSSASPTVLFIIYFIIPVAFLLVYVITQTILVINSLDDRWPLGDLYFGLIFYIIGLVLQFGLSTVVCNMSDHYIDGLFFGCVFTLLGVMMVYKYWDSITREDLEFSVDKPVEDRTPLIVG
ncbi:Chitin synthase, class 7 [Chytriomyces hyalinus]|nr:Chitin synthase, class 7 [Chytriomyces hyalinus]KAJ3258417.1 Chitin synthase, class 7 [Chytriomyces hyalinus]